MKMYASIAVAGATMCLLAGCAATPDEAPSGPDPHHGVPVEIVRGELEQAYLGAGSFWAAQGVAGAPSLALPGNETITCGTETITPAKGREVVAAACFATNTLIVWPESLAERANTAVDRGAGMRNGQHDYRL